LISTILSQEKGKKKGGSGTRSNCDGSLSHLKKKKKKGRGGTPIKSSDFLLGEKKKKKEKEWEEKEVTAPIV